MVELLDRANPNCISPAEQAPLLNYLGNYEPKLILGVIAATGYVNNPATRTEYKDAVLARQGEHMPPLWPGQQDRVPYDVISLAFTGLHIATEERPGRGHAMKLLWDTVYADKILGFCGFGIQWSKQHKLSVQHLLGRSSSEGFHQSPELRSRIFRILLAEGEMPSTVALQEQVNTPGYQPRSLHGQVRSLITLGLLTRHLTRRGEGPLRIADTHLGAIEDFFVQLDKLQDPQNMRAPQKHATDFIKDTGAVRALLEKAMRIAHGKRAAEVRTGLGVSPEAVILDRANRGGVTLAEARTALQEQTGHTYYEGSVRRLMGKLFNEGKICILERGRGSIPHRYGPAF